MPRASSRKLAATVASRIYSKRRQKLERSVGNRTVIAVTTLLSKKYGLLPCFCDHDPIRMVERHQALILSKSSNAFWQRDRKSKAKFVVRKQQRNNSTTLENEKKSKSRSRHFIRKTIVQRYKRNNKKKMPTITARSVIKPRNSTVYPSNNVTNRPLLTQFNSEHSLYDSDHLTSPKDSNDTEENDKDEKLKPPLSSFKTEQQNINATNNISRTIQETSQTIMNDLDPSNSWTKAQEPVDKTVTRSTVGSSKRKTSLSNKKLSSLSKRKNSKTNVERMTYGRSPFTDPDMFHSMPQMQNS
jgi:hypothetical protein